MTKIIISLLSFAMFISIASASETVKGAKKDLETFKKEMSVKLESVDNQLKELRTKAKAKSSQAQEKTINELQESRDKLQAQIDEMKTNTKSNWKKFKSDMSSSIDSLSTKVKKSLED